MIEMLELNPFNTTTTASSITDFNDIFTQNTTTLQQNVTNSILADVITNTTALAVDYATEWLASTTVSSVGNETTSLFTATLDTILNHSYYPATSSHNINITPPHINAADLITANPKIINNDVDDDDDGYDKCHPESNKFNCSRSDFLSAMLGDQTLPLHKALMITILYGGIFITGFFGNVLVCVVIVKHSAMHTATNYYLFSLAASDLIYLIFGLPTEVYLYWHQYPYLFGLPFCKARAYISEASTYVSVLTIVAFSVERYLAICHPLHLYAMSGFKRALRIIAMLWLVSFIAAIPFGLWSQINFMFYPPDKSLMPESAFCSCNTPENVPLFEISFLVFFLIPMLLIFYFYGRMGAKIRSRTSQKLGVQKGSLHRESRHQQSRKAVIRMLAAVVLTFFVCWLPFHIQRLWIVYGKPFTYYLDINEWLFSITGFAYYVSCTINPILYNVMSHRYRVAFKDILCGKRRNVYYNNGFARDQSSFRETVATSVCNTSDRSHSVRVRSVTIVDNVNHRTSIKSNNSLWKKTDFNTPLEKDIPENHSTKLAGTNAVVVCVDNGVNGRTKVFTENEKLLNQNNETCI